MKTAIEQLLLGDEGVFNISEFTVSPGVVRLRLAPWEGPWAETVAVFGAAQLTSVEVYPDLPDDIALPWDIIGIECDELGEGRWRFVFHCDAIEFGFESRWPAVTRHGS